MSPRVTKLQSRVPFQSSQHAPGIRVESTSCPQSPCSHALQKAAASSPGVPELPGAPGLEGILLVRVLVGRCLDDLQFSLAAWSLRFVTCACAICQPVCQRSGLGGALCREPCFAVGLCGRPCIQLAPDRGTDPSKWKTWPSFREFTAQKRGV